MKTIVVWLTNKEVSCWNFEEKHKKRIEQNLPDVKIVLCPDKDSFLKALPEADTIFVWVFKQEWLESAPKLKLIMTPAAGKEFIQVELPPGISIERTTFHGNLIGETVAGMILSHSRGIMSSYNLQKSELWPRRELDAKMRLVRGSRVTILGFGNLGSIIGRLIKPFGAHIYGIKRSITPNPDYFDDTDLILPIDKLKSVLPETDHLVLSLPVTDGTTDIINKKCFSLLPPHAALYNVGRGNAVDEAALIEALTSGKVAAAYLDVFKEEPLPMDSPLRSCPQCFLMPHASGIAPDFMDFFVDEYLEKHGKNT